MTRLKLGTVAFLSIKPLRKKQKNIVSKKQSNLKENSYTNTNKRKGEGDDFEIIILDLKPHLVSPFSLGWGGHRATLLK